MPYQVEVQTPPSGAFELLVDLGALDVDTLDHGLTAIMPDTVDAGDVARVLGTRVSISPAVRRDDGSVWVVEPRVIQIGRFTITPADFPPRSGALRMVDSSTFGTGLHPTTSLCLQVLDAELNATRPASVLDVGTGSGILALAALCAGVRCAVAIDIDADATRIAATNAQLNGLTSRLSLVQGGPEALSGSWPLVMANILAAPLMQMAHTIGRRVGHNGQLILSGIRSSLAPDVERAFRSAGMRRVRADARDGWTAVILQASW